MRIIDMLNAVKSGTDSGCNGHSRPQTGVPHTSAIVALSADPAVSSRHKRDKEPADGHQQRKHPASAPAQTTLPAAACRAKEQHHNGLETCPLTLARHLDVPGQTSNSTPPTTRPTGTHSGQTERQSGFPKPSAPWHFAPQAEIQALGRPTEYCERGVEIAQSLPQPARERKKSNSSCSLASEIGNTLPYQQHTLASQADLDARMEKQHSRPFNCVFDFAGCESTFATKNEWKRHVKTQHLLLNFWQCTGVGCSKIFNRKDLFTIHLTRMHAPENLRPHTRSKKPEQRKERKKNTAQATQELAVWKKRAGDLHKAAVHSRCELPIYMCCPVPGCTAEFRGVNAWDQRMEHVAQNITSPGNCGSSTSASGKVMFGGEKDKTLVDWASRLDVGIIVRGKEGEWVLKPPLNRGPGGSVAVVAPVQELLFDVASWVGKAYHDRKLEQLREKNGLPRVGRPPAYATGGPGSGNAKKGSASAPGSAQASRKRKGPHETPESTPSKSKAGGAGVNSRPSSAAGTGGTAAAEAGGSQRHKKIKIIIRQSSGGDGASKNPKIILNSLFPASALDYDGYTSSDSISSDQLHTNDWRLHQVRTRTFATNPNVTQYWHWVTEKNPRDDKVIEHQVLKSVRPTKWSVFKQPYNFHLKLGDVQEVSFTRDTTQVIVTHQKGKDGQDTQARGDVMAQFKRERTKRRFLTFLREKGVNVVEVTRDVMDERWNSYDPATLSGPDSDSASNDWDSDSTSNDSDEDYPGGK